MRGGVDEVAKGAQRRGEAYNGAIECKNYDLGVSVEGVREVDVVRDEVTDELLADAGV